MSDKTVTVHLTEKEARMLGELLEKYKLPSFNQTMKMCLHKTYFHLMKTSKDDTSKGKELSL